MSTRSERHWDKRFLRIAEERIKLDDNYIKHAKSLYRRTQKAIAEELEDFYQKYAVNDQLSKSDAKRLLSKAEQKNWSMTLEDFRQKAKKGGYHKQLNREYYKSRVSRLQHLQTQINMQLVELANQEEALLRNHLNKVANHTYYRNVYEIQRLTGFSANFAKLNTRALDAMLKNPFHGSNFSKRVWKNDTKKLAKELKKVMSTGIARGDGIDRMSQELAKKMDVAKNKAVTLVQTESAQIAGQATAKAYEETGVDEYTFLATLEKHTCSKCHGLDGKHFKLKNKKVGVNYEPIHPNCRCTTVPKFDDMEDDERWARNPETGKGEVIKDMSYKEWQEKYVA